MSAFFYECLWCAKPVPEEIRAVPLADVVSGSAAAFPSSMSAWIVVGVGAAEGVAVGEVGHRAAMAFGCLECGSQVPQDVALSSLSHFLVAVSAGEDPATLAQRLRTRMAVVRCDQCKSVLTGDTEVSDVCNDPGNPNHGACLFATKEAALASVGRMGWRMEGEYVFCPSCVTRRLIQ